MSITHGKQLIPGAFMSNNIFQIVSRIKKVKPQNKKYVLEISDNTNMQFKII